MKKTLGLAAAVTLAAGLYAASVSSAAGKRVETQLRRTVSCATSLRALQISAFASNPNVFHGAASLSIDTGSPNANASKGLLGLSTQQNQYGLSSSCHSVTKRVPLTHRGLTSAGASHAGDITWREAYCPAPRHVLLHFVLGFDSTGKPVSATIAIRTQPKAPGGKSKPIGFVQWSPARSITYAASACTVQNQ